MNPGWSLSTWLGGDYRITVRVDVPGSTECGKCTLPTPSTKILPKRLGFGLILSALPCCWFCFCFNPQVQQHRLIGWEGMQNSGSKWTSLPFVVVCVTCMQLDFLNFFFQAQDKSLSFQHLVHLPFQPSGCCILQGPNLAVLYSH